MDVVVDFTRPQNGLDGPETVTKELPDNKTEEVQGIQRHGNADKSELTAGRLEGLAVSGGPLRDTSAEREGCIVQTDEEVMGESSEGWELFNEELVENCAGREAFTDQTSEKFVVEGLESSDVFNGELVGTSTWTDGQFLQSCQDSEDEFIPGEEERLPVIDGKLAGTTGIVEDGEIVPIQGRHLNKCKHYNRAFSDLSSLPPNFDDKGTSIQKAKQATSLLMVEYSDSEDQSVGRIYATAFFVDKSKVLTAAHTVLLVPTELLARVDKKKTRIYLFPPGKVRHSTEEATLRRPYTYLCKIVAYLSPHSKSSRAYKSHKDMSRDIAILSVDGMQFAEECLEFSFQGIPVGAIVDLVGYPGDQSIDWLHRNHPKVADQAAIQTEGETLLPPRTMVVTRGQLTNRVMDLLMYTNATSPGLSGSCLLYNGKVCGMKSQ